MSLLLYPSMQCNELIVLVNVNNVNNFEHGSTFQTTGPPSQKIWGFEILHLHVLHLIYITVKQSEMNFKKTAFLHLHQMSHRFSTYISIICISFISSLKLLKRCPGHTEVADFLSES